MRQERFGIGSSREHWTDGATGSLVVVASLLLGPLLLVCMMPGVEADSMELLTTINHGQYYTETLSGEWRKDARLNIEFEVQNGGDVDVYILSDSQFQRYLDGLYFSTEVGHEWTSSEDFRWTLKDDDEYHILIDNRDNGRGSDARPIGSVEFTLKMDDEDTRWAVLLCFLGIFVIICVIAIATKNVKREPPRYRHKGSSRPPPLPPPLPASLPGLPGETRREKEAMTDLFHIDVDEVQAALDHRLVDHMLESKYKPEAAETGRMAPPASQRDGLPEVEPESSFYDGGHVSPEELPPLLLACPFCTTEVEIFAELADPGSIRCPECRKLI